ncbi:MAG: acetate--CoA ligase [Actinobacteria bacterium]|nr:acetate--CoA ligase [Actinomycetota bacterium]
MDWRTIEKLPVAGGTVPNLVDYEETCRTFSWEGAGALLDGLPGGSGLNIAHEAVDRHVAHGRGDRVALRCLDRAGNSTDLTYRDLQEQTNRFADALRTMGVARGERVFVLAGRIPELYIAVLGTLKAGCVASPLFSAFGPEPIRQRLSLGDARVLVTTEALYVKKVAKLRDSLPGMEQVLVIGQGGDGRRSDTVDFHEALGAGDPSFAIAPTDPEDMALLHFTSGTTGTPKGAIHVHQAVVSHHVTGAYALDLHPEDVFWCTADPGWVTGTSYGIISPLTHGVTCIIDEGEFDAERWYRILAEQQVTVWYTAPTAVRMLMRAGTEPARDADLSALRFVASVGEPLNPEAVVWGQEAWGRPIHDNWWQTETGGIMIANYAAMDIRPGSMGRPMPGVEVAILLQGDDGRAKVADDGTVEVIEKPNVEGELAIRPGWPSMFRGYLHDEARYEACFAGGWYLSGDVARFDEDGWFWFVGRADDVIKSAGHLIGPFEVESTLMEHPAVVEAGVIGKPDPVAGSIVKAFVSLREGFEPTDDLRLELIGFARTRLGPAVAPRELDFDQHLPKTKSGKIMRRLLKARELGLPEGDLSTLERDA